MNYYPPNLFLLAGISLLLTACTTLPPSSDQALPYPAQYRQALNDFPGDSDIEPSTINEFVTFLANLGEASTGATAASLYAEELHFSDALMVTRDKQTVVNHFNRLSKAGTRVDVQIHQTLQSDRDVYLIWSMQARFTPIQKEVTSDTLGVTHVRFDATGRVVLHQDFWDSGLGFYSHIPVLGAGVRAVGRRFAADK